MTDCFLSISLHVSCTFVRTTFKKCTDTPILRFAKVKNVKRYVSGKVFTAYKHIVYCL